MDWDQMFCNFSAAVSSDNPQLQAKAAIAVARRPDHIPATTLSSAIPKLVNLLARGSTLQVKESAAHALFRLARTYRHDVISSALAQSCGVQTILGLLPLSQLKFRRILLKFINTLVCTDGPSRMTMARHGGLQLLLDMIRLSTDADERVRLLEILTALTLLRQVRRDIVAHGGLTFLVQALSSGRMFSRIRAAHAVGLLGIPKRIRHMLVELGAIHPLIELLTDSDGGASAKLVAGNALGVVSSYVGYLRLVGEGGAVALYAELLEGNDPIGKEIAEDVFCILAVAKENAVLIFEQLAAILQGNSKDAKSAAIDVLWGLSSYNHSVSVVLVSGIIPLLLDILQNEDVDLQEKAAGAISQLSYIKENRVAMAKVGAIQVLIGIFLGDSEVVKEFAVEALVNFSDDPSFREELAQVSDMPSFRSIKDRLIRLHVRDEQMVSSLRLLSVEQLTSD